MKVVFLQDVPNVAKAGEIKEVAAGYGRNFLIPRKLAALASPQAMSQVETGGKAQARTDGELVELAQQLEGKEVSLKAHAGAKERLYGSITSADIAAELESATGIVVDKRKIELDKPIHQLGSYELTVKLGKDITPKIKVNVIEEETKAEEKPAKKAKKTTKKAEKAPKAASKETKPKAEKETKPRKPRRPRRKPRRPRKRSPPLKRQPLRRRQRPKLRRRRRRSKGWLARSCRRMTLMPRKR
jgi:large subunit ribosomal protein L9